jgi:hypothetical protein
MDSASDAAFFDVARMHRDISFIPLLHLLQHSGGLLNGYFILLIFIHILLGILFSRYICKLICDKLPVKPLSVNTLLSLT